MIGRLTLVILLWFSVPSLRDVAYADPSAIDFNRDVRPILSDKCFHCHGPDAAHREADLRLDVEESAKADLGDYHAIVPGKPAESALIERITTEDVDERMPPEDSGKDLTNEEIAILRQWVEQGAVWSEPWSYVPPRRNELPTVELADWPLNWIDRFVLSKLESKEVAPATEADPVTLIRRLSFDLIGLPPTPEEVDAFVEDHSADAYERFVDRLLASPRYGERMAIYWLDLVRYADTVGYHGDQDHNISPYRDYVIDAFNDNMPLDRFTREQLAGDLLPDSTTDQKIASGYNRMLQTSHEGGVQEKEYLAIYAADRVRNISNVWMGATMGCCQCHDHKFDPITTKDFYSMAAFFADLDEAQHLRKIKGLDGLPTVRPPEMKMLTKHERQRIAELEQSIQQLGTQLAELSSGDVEKTEAVKKQIASAEKHLETIKNNARMTMISVSIEPRTMRVLPRGNWMDDSGPIVEPAVPEFLGKIKTGNQRATRLDLANWLTDSEQGVGGLTARVFANRFWYLFFGTGIARVLDDFGGQGEPPFNPELLDNLAVEFVENGWDVKHMVKLLVMSRAYRQSSLEPEDLRRTDPYNRLVAHQARFRLPAEMIRDNALAISGLLVLDYGGPSVRPYQPIGYYRHLNFPMRKYEQHTDSRQWRRGVYMHWQRQFLHPMLKAFDAPTREECTAQRPRSNTPLAALALLNDPTFIEAARVFAEKIIREGGPTTESRLEFAFRQAISRKPDAFETETMSGLLKSNLQKYEDNPEAARKLIRTGLSPVAEDIDPAQWSAWTSVARALLNMSETITRN